MAKRKFSLMEEVQKTASQEDIQGVQIDKESIIKDNIKHDMDSKESVKTDDVRATFIMDAMMVRRVKLIAALDKCRVKDVVAAAFSSYIESWELAHPMINLDAIDKIANK